jgi:hypothetical protein
MTDHFTGRQGMRWGRSVLGHAYTLHHHRHRNRTLSPGEGPAETNLDAHIFEGPYQNYAGD